MIKNKRLGLSIYFLNLFSVDATIMWAPIKVSSNPISDKKHKSTKQKSDPNQTKPNQTKAAGQTQSQTRTKPPRTLQITEGFLNGWFIYP